MLSCIQHVALVCSYRNQGYGLHKTANEENPFLHEKIALFLITKGEKKAIEYPL